MKTRWKKASEAVSAFSQREKILLLLMGIILIPGIIDFFLLQPLRDETASWNKKTQSINQQIISFGTQQEELLLEIKNDPAMELERRIEGVTKALNASKQALVSYTDTLIPPQKMAAMLESMLHESGELKLLSLENLPVTPLFSQQKKDDNKTDDVAEAETDVFGLYRHGIKIVFKGSYMKTMNYLGSLEQLPWNFYWQRFDYQVERHPNAIITLQIYTLSTSRWWIGDED